MLRSLVAKCALMALFIGFLMGGVEVPPAHGDVLGYPNYNMPCEHSPYNVTGACANYDWGLTHTEAYDDPSEFSSRGYAYRNCTDYVAWKLQSLGVPDPKTRGLRNGGSWYDNAPGNGLSRGTTPAVGSAAVVPGSPGHVAYVEAVHTVDGTTTITVTEYNHDGLGNGDTRTGTPSSMGFTEYVYFASLMTTPPVGGPSSSAPPAPIDAVSSTDKVAKDIVGTTHQLYTITSTGVNESYWTPGVYPTTWWVMGSPGITGIDKDIDPNGTNQLYAVNSSGALESYWVPGDGNGVTTSLITTIG